MRLTTTDIFQGIEIRQYLGVAAGEVIYGAHAGKDMLAKFRDAVGGRSNSYESVTKEARSTALREMWKNAKEMGANAVVGVRVDYHSLGQENSMLMVCATGTAVVIPEEALTRVPSYADVLTGAARQKPGLFRAGGSSATIQQTEKAVPNQPSQSVPAQISARLPVA